MYNKLQVTMAPHQAELWVEGEVFVIDKHTLTIAPNIDDSDILSGKRTAALEITFPLTTILSNDIKDWLSQGKSVKDTDFILFSDGTLTQHFKFVKARCEAYDECYNEHKEALYLSVKIHSKNLEFD